MSDIAFFVAGFVLGFLACLLGFRRSMDEVARLQGRKGNRDGR